MREFVRFEIVGELIHLVEIDTGPKSEGMRDRLGGVCPRLLRLGSQARSDRSVHHLFEGNTELPGSLFQQSSQVVIESQCRPHGFSVDASLLDVKASESAKAT